MKIALIKYNAGNVQSVLYALARLGVDAELTDDPEKICSADRVIFPGQGEASSAMAYLRERNLDQVIREVKQPFLGVCLGLQLLCTHSEENDTTCLGIFPQLVKRFIPSASGQEKVPHVGWNSLENLVDNPLIKDLPDAKYMYYVHSYYATLGEGTIASTQYIHDFTAILHRNNYWAIQAHPEKSSTLGEKLLENFLALPST
ncbi:MAG: imidazole glycerol phosphate synthase subunit HisH [Bacteroidetes bacterium]|nr:imidazole glycerol phosphate synthase subunit HisH [Bacteroidota bacterium]MDA1267558.1 imidazole glycerol phosphate synthase subunit HisH [Bacteroidota bacterium]